MKETGNAVAELEAHEQFDVEHLADRLEGRSGGLRTSKPTAQDDTGLEQYVWRMARFHSGKDPKMPVTASFWLSDWVDSEIESDVSVTGILEDSDKKFLRCIDEIVDEILVEKFSLDPSGGAKRWKKAGAF